MSLRAVILAGLAIAAAAAIPRASAQSLRDWRALANKMVDDEIASAGVTNERVLRAMRDTPRHEFVPPNQRRLAYYDMALPIGDAANHLAAVRRRLHDAGNRSAADRPGARDRHRQRLPGGRPQPARQRRLHDRDRRAARQTRRPHAQEARLQKRVRQSRRRLPRLARGRARSTRSSSPARRKKCRSRSSISSATAD